MGHDGCRICDCRKWKPGGGGHCANLNSYHDTCLHVYDQHLGNVPGACKICDCPQWKPGGGGHCANVNSYGDTCTHVHDQHNP